jgi:AraC-like DNA-binding protein
LEKHAHRARLIVEANYRETGLSTAGVARRMGLSREYLCRAVKAITGRTLLALLHEYRIQEGCRLLHGTDFSVKRIALEIGYASTSKFDYHFVKRCRMSPTEFREMPRRQAGS